MPDALPRLRPEIDAVPSVRDGEAYYILHDRSGIAGARLLMSPLGLLIAGRVDGTASVLDIVDALDGELGRDAPLASEVATVIDALDDAYFLDSPRFEDFAAQAARDFLAAPVRLACSAGQVYDSDPVLLAASLDRMAAEAPQPEETPGVWPGHPAGVIVPHIDYARGGAGYGQVYRFLAGVPRPKTVVVLGTAHVPLPGRFSLCDKDFDTPFGRVRVDGELAAALRRAVKPYGDIDAGVLAHRSEHSIELQAVWLRHIYGEDIRIVPLLAGAIAEYADGVLPPESARNDPAIRAVADCLSAVAGDGVMLMASADLAHVGPCFGDEREVDGKFLAEVEQADREYLAAVAVGASEGLSCLAAHADRYHVCGTACIFTMGLALPGASAKLLGYHQAVTPEMRQAVTYAGMVMA